MTHKSTTIRAENTTRKQKKGNKDSQQIDETCWVFWKCRGISSIVVTLEISQKGNKREVHMHKISNKQCFHHLMNFHPTHKMYKHKEDTRRAVLQTKIKISPQYKPVHRMEHYKWEDLKTTKLH